MSSDANRSESCGGLGVRSAKGSGAGKAHDGAADLFQGLRRERFKKM
jgi:hypothetical protein